MASITLRKLTKRFGGSEVIRGIDLEIEEGEFVVLVGPSGCGKSTLLNLVAGLETATEGDILIGGQRVNDVPPKDRDIAMVFQSYALYPTKTVRDNITFGMKARGATHAEQEAAVTDVSGLLHIGPLLERKPSQLSGGQRQRVAMGRALVRKPAVFLFDEPLSNLDAKLRIEMRTEIKKLHQRLGKTTVYVTHDQIEAMTLASRIAVMDNGRIRQFDTPHAIYEDPADLFVAGFMGSPPMNMVKGKLRRGQMLAVEVGETPAMAVSFPLPGQLADRVAEGDGHDVVLGLRAGGDLCARQGTARTRTLQFRCGRGGRGADGARHDAGLPRGGPGNDRARPAGGRTTRSCSLRLRGRHDAGKALRRKDGAEALMAQQTDPATSAESSETKPE